MTTVFIPVNKQAQRIAELEAQVAELREHMADLRKRYPNSPWIYEIATAALEVKS